MSGHSKWAQIKRKKGVNDTRRGQLFTRLGREIMIAARSGGSGDPDANFQLRLAVDKARASNMPKENIERAIKRGTGELGEGQQLEDLMYEGYGPGGTAILVQVVTDNRNRAASDVRRLFTRSGGNIGAANSVQWMFERRGVLLVDATGKDADELQLELIDAGADDVRVDGHEIEVYTSPENLRSIREELQKHKVHIDSAEITWVPKTPAAVTDEEAVKTMQFVEALEELDDVQKVISNLEISDAVMAKFETA